MNSVAGRLVIATAGHVDHGKTGLVYALTGVETDRLREEQDRGISIELGFASIPDSHISLIDVPGHRRLVHTMIAGVGGVDVVLLVIAADDGPMPQTREHLWICRLLGVRQLVIAVSKSDLVDKEQLARRLAEAQRLARDFGYSHCPLIATSIASFEGIDELAKQLTQLSNTLAPRASRPRTWLAIDRCFSIKGAGSVVTGTLSHGSLQVGQKVEVVSSRQRRRVTCRGLEVHGEAVECVHAPSRLAINLAIDREHVQRGDVLSDDPELPIATQLDVSLDSVEALPNALVNYQPVTVHLGTSRCRGSLVWHGPGLAHLKLESPIPAEGGQRLILRGFAEHEAGAVLAGGVILDATPDAPVPQKRAERRALRLRLLQQLQSGDLRRALVTLAELSLPRAVDLSRIPGRFGYGQAEVRAALESARQHEELEELGSCVWIPKQGVARLQAELEQRLRSQQEQQPAHGAVPLETLRAELARRSDRRTADYVVDQSRSAGLLWVDRSGNASLKPGFVDDPLAAHAELLEQLKTQGLAGSDEAALSESLGLPRQQIQRSLRELERAKQALRLSGVWYAEAALEQLRAWVAERLKNSVQLTIQDVKAHTQTSRKQVVSLLEQLDREGVTTRRGDGRGMGPRLARRLKAN